MKFTKCIYVLSFLVFTIGCTELDETVYDGIPIEQYPENAQQAATINVAAYAGLQPFADDEGWWFLAQEVSSDEICFPTRAADWDDGGKWRVMYQHTWTNDVEGINRMWSTMNKGVTLCNKAIEVLRLSTSTQKETKIAETEVLRSFYYYLIIDNFGDAPYLTSFKDAPEEPFKNSREAIFDSLVNTIKRDLPKLEMVDKKYLATKAMAYALLAKLYLNSEVYTGVPQWQNALDYCDSVIDCGLYDFVDDPIEPFITENQNSPEIIFSIPYDEDGFQGFRLHMRTLHYQSNLTFDMLVGPWNGCCVTLQHYNTYATNDIRKAVYFLVGQQYDSKGNQIIDSESHTPLIFNPYVPLLVMTSTNTKQEIRMSGARLKKYEIKKGAKENLSNDLVLFRYTDILLMKAEALIRLGQNGDEYVNLVRNRAGLDDWTNVGLDSLLAERGREMFCEGHRRQDLIRFGKWEQAWWEKQATDQSRREFPIPKWATDANPNLLLDPVK
jgi:starch-binding outer membrane protein, SusD/RagB family